MASNPFSPQNDSLDPEHRQLANRAFLHQRELSPHGLEELRALSGRDADDDPRLATEIGGLKLANPLMVAAGWDKFGESVRGLYELGFGAVEVGTIPRDAQPGNPEPRHFVLGPGVMLNRYGFNSPGAATVKENLRRYQNSGVPVGINVGKNKDVSLTDAPQAHAEVVALLYEEATYFSLGVSSPNTVDVRAQQAKHILHDIGQAVQDVLRSKPAIKPVFVKIGPDLEESEVADIIEVVEDLKLTGIIAANTTTSEGIKAKYGEQWRHEMGGLSGDDEDFRKLSTEMIKFIHKETSGSMPIIGVGGIRDTHTALEKLQAGASAVQIMSALNFHGPNLATDIKQGLVDYMDRTGTKHISKLVGTSE